MRSPQLNPIGLGTNTINSNRERSVSHLLNQRQLLTSRNRSLSLTHPETESCYPPFVPLNIDSILA
ncbi:hypothetical protein PGT21_027617 [Puccinia graminis f. sp. tritici]|uniref:Uncharacterized protein n=1 Tax=Puccinia graminis f. sp. tritici TaxID=56615 RepID=A0A5B0MY56_PUCGR|nr:hypothetical protein PGT21_027617 [Puccinia graminis f. sp. tritici]